MRLVLDTLSSICMRSFSTNIAHNLSVKGFNTFSKLATPTAFAQRINQDNIILIAQENKLSLGMIELKAGAHVAMLFVQPQYQNMGIGRELFNSALKYVRSNTLTVSASLPSVPFYKKLGFNVSQNVAESEGLVYQPMVIELLR